MAAAREKAEQLTDRGVTFGNLVYKTQNDKRALPLSKQLEQDVLKLSKVTRSDLVSI